MQFNLLTEKDVDLAADVQFMTQSLYAVLENHADEIVVNAVKILAKAQDASQVVTTLLPTLSLEQTENLITAVGMFAQMLNIAEDVHHERRRLAHEWAGDAPHNGDVAETVKKFKRNDINSDRIQAALNATQVNAVLTAHPTEVQRQATLISHRKIRALLPRRAQCHSAEELAELQREMDIVLLTLWQTSETRHFKISVKSEINNGVNIFPMSFFKPFPNCIAAWKSSFRQPSPKSTFPTF